MRPSPDTSFLPPTVALVPILGPVTVTLTVWAGSSMLAWAASSIPSLDRLSKATISAESTSPVVSKVNCTTVSPSAVSGVKVLSAWISSPATLRASPVFLSMRMP